jgi:hypothetical protein
MSSIHKEFFGYEGALGYHARRRRYHSGNIITVLSHFCASDILQDLIRVTTGPPRFRIGVISFTQPYNVLSGLYRCVVAPLVISVVYEQRPTQCVMHDYDSSF